jgi:hypothetical protein
MDMRIQRRPSRSNHAQSVQGRMQTRIDSTHDRYCIEALGRGGMDIANIAVAATMHRYEASCGD